MAVSRHDWGPSRCTESLWIKTLEDAWRTFLPQDPNPTLPRIPGSLLRQKAEGEGGPMPCGYSGRNRRPVIANVVGVVYRDYPSWVMGLSFWGEQHDFFMFLGPGF